MATTIEWHRIWIRADVVNGKRCINGTDLSEALLMPEILTTRCVGDVKWRYEQDGCVWYTPHGITHTLHIMGFFPSTSSRADMTHDLNKSLRESLVIEKHWCCWKRLASCSDFGG
jgi:hypothetical protein